MQEPPRSYVLCGTPRTGSTLLCSLLYSTGVLGRPESYFREPEEAAWAARLGPATEGGRAAAWRPLAPAARRPRSARVGLPRAGGSRLGRKVRPRHRGRACPGLPRLREC